MESVICSIIIPSFNTLELTIECLRSIDRHPPSRPYEIILVDNHSTDGTEERVRNDFPTVRVIRNAANLGFGKACNIGARQSQGQYLLFLNSDTESLPGTFDQLIQWMETHPQTGCVGPELVSPQRSLIQMSWAWNPILFGELIALPLAPYMVRRSRLRQWIVRQLQRRPRNVSIICGACTLVRKRLFESLGGFDEDFELYFEDSDLCMRCRHLGWQVDFVPHSKIVHRLGQSTKASWGLTPLVYRQSQIHYYRKHAPAWAVPLLKGYLTLKWMRLWIRMKFFLPNKEAVRTYLEKFRVVIHEKQRLTLAQPMEPAKRTQNVLIVKLAAIGDVVLSTPAIAAVRRRHPEARISCLIGNAAAPLLERNPHMDCLLRIDERIFWRKRLRPLMKLFQCLKSEPFDTVYILHWSPWFHFYFWLMGIPQRVGFARGGRSFRLTRAVPYREGDASAHDIDQYLRLVDGADAPGSAGQDPPCLFLNTQEIQETREWLATRGLSPTTAFISVALGGGNNPKLFMPQKRWPVEHYARLLEALLAQENMTAVLVGDHTEAGLLDRVAPPALRKRLVEAAGELTLRQTAAVIQRSKLFIGNDSGLLHVAGAVGTPSLSFFGPTSPGGKTPVWAPHQFFYTAEPCSPCYQYGNAPPCPYRLKCLWNITPAQALDAARRLLHPRTSAHVS